MCPHSNVQAAEVVGSHKEELLAARYTFAIMDMLKEMKAGSYQWADGST